MTSKKHLCGVSARRHALIALLSVILLLLGHTGYADSAQDDTVLRIVFFANSHGTAYPCPT